jgi:glucose/arabinose dehydrogenase
MTHRLPPSWRGTALVACAALLSCPSARADLVNRWSFNQTSGNAPSGTNLADSVSGQLATVRGINGVFTGTALTLPGTTTGNQSPATVAAYVDLPNGLISSKENLTIEAWVTPVSSKNFQRLFDFGNINGNGDGLGATGEWTGGSSSAPGGTSAADEFGLSLNFGADLNGQRLYGRLNYQQTGGLNLYVDTTVATTAGQRYHYVVTFEKGVGTYGSGGGRESWYRDGVLIATLDLPYHLSAINDVNNWLGRSQFSADSMANASYDEFRVYNHAFTPADVITSRDIGPDSVPVFPAPVAAADAATMHAGQKVLVDVLANDTGSLYLNSVAIATPPSAGTATVDASGRILYTNTSTVASDSFTYTVSGPGGPSAPATVNITFSNNLRIANPGLAMPSASPATYLQVVDALPGVTFNQPICISNIPGDSLRLFVCERIAKIQLVPDVTASSPTKTVFLDLQQVVSGRSPTETIEGGGNAEHGLLGLAFHPNYATNGYFYAAYTVRISGGSYYQRISRFKVSAANPNAADPASELILLQQLDQGSNHDGGDLHFGPDGYLYYAAGDEEAQRDLRFNSQKINLDFFSGIFRIDVDKKPGNLAPNPHSAIPTDNGVARFSVPADNPFIHTSLGGTWNGTINGVAITPLSSVRTEFWAYGLRHPWRMSFDSLNGDLWAGDVGQDTYEEVNLIQKGGNYGWVYREGAHDTNFTNPTPPAKPAGFSSINPVYEYVHASIAGDAQFKGNSVCGGYVYRGSRFPALYGCYLFCDSVSGHIWSRNPTSGTVTRITGVPGVYGALSTMGVDPFTRDPLFADYINGKILRLSTGTADTTFPATLSATGLFSDLTDLSPSPGLLPYEPNLAFWSDHAIKRRWFSIPQANDTMTWMFDENWTYPTGMLWVKHFDLETTRGNPATKRRIETRVVVKTDGGSYGVSYRWNDAQTEATLVPDEGAEFNLDVVENGSSRTQRWQIPSRSSCLTCHTPQAGHALSFNTRQLNRTAALNGTTGNQLSLLYTGGYLANDPGSPNLLPRHVRPDETDYSMEARVRSYLAVNCAYCHQEGGTVADANWDGSAHLTLAETGLIDGIATNNGGDSLNKYIVRGDATHSIVLNRMAVTNGFTRMPPLGSTELDQTNIVLVQDWITQSLPERLTYDEWRFAEFGSSSSSEGTASSDPDGDGQTNEQEFVANTDPRSPASFLATQLSADGANITLTFNVPEGRSALIETSADLNAWSLWDIPGNNGLPLASGPVSFSGPASGAKQFFRLRLQGN